MFGHCSSQGECDCKPDLPSPPPKTSPLPPWYGYQVRIDGQDVQVQDLTVEQLRNQLCVAIDFLEVIDERAQNNADLMKAWRNGFIAPDRD